MKTSATLTTLTALAVAGAAAACESTTPPTQLVAAPTAPSVMFVGHDGHDAHTKTTSKELKVVVTDGNARYWVNGKEVDRATFAEAGGNVVISGKASTPKAVARLPRIKEAPVVEAVASPKPRLGVVLGSVSGELAEKIDVDADEVILIERVIDGTPAARAGLKSFDVLVEFDGEDDLSVEKLRKMIAKQKPGGEVDVRVIREGNKKDFEVIFEGGTAQFAVRPSEPAPAAPRARFFGGELDEDQQMQVEKAMRLAEKYSQEAQKHAERWTHKIEGQAKHLEGLGERLALRFDGQSREDFESAMEELHEALAEYDIAFDFDVDFDADAFPKIQFIELGEDHRNRAAVLERKLRSQEQQRVRQDERLHLKKLREQERSQERNMHIEERREEAAERQIERLENRIEELEAMIEKLVEKMEHQRPRGVRN